MKGVYPVLIYVLVKLWKIVLISGINIKKIYKLYILKCFSLIRYFFKHPNRYLAYYFFSIFLFGAIYTFYKDDFSVNENLYEYWYKEKKLEIENSISLDLINNFNKKHKKHVVLIKDLIINSKYFRAENMTYKDGVFEFDVSFEIFENEQNGMELTDNFISYVNSKKYKRSAVYCKTIKLSIGLGGTKLNSQGKKLFFQTLIGDVHNQNNINNFFIKIDKNTVHSKPKNIKFNQIIIADTLKNNYDFTGTRYIFVSDYTNKLLEQYKNAHENNRYDIDFGNMLYFSVVTITTLGYGDISPKTGFARFLISTEVLVGILLFGFFLNELAMYKKENK